MCEHGWIDLAQDKNKWPYPAETVMNLRVYLIKWGEFLYYVRDCELL
jgi:hypothetical protein